MKIMCDAATRRAAVQQRKAAYRADKAQRMSAYGKAHGAYEADLQKYLDQAEDRIRRAVPGSGDLYIEVQAIDWGRPNNTLHVVIQNYPKNDPLAGRHALKFEMIVYLADNDVSIRTSPQGLRAETKQDVMDMQKTVSQLNTLVGLNWEFILGDILPDFSDYSDMSNPELERDPDFELEEKYAEIADIVGDETKAVEVYGQYFKSYADKFVQIVKETRATFEVRVIDAKDIEEGITVPEVNALPKKRVSREKLLMAINDEFVIADIPE